MIAYDILHSVCSEITESYTETVNYYLLLILPLTMLMKASIFYMSERALNLALNTAKPYFFEF